jgi:hypothetical protein
MSTSSNRGALPFDPTVFGADEPMGAVRYRDELLDTALHKADSIAQVRYAWTAPDPSLLAGNETPETIPHTGTDLDEATVDSPRWFGFGEGVTYCPKVRADGSAYPLRIDLAGASSGGDRVDFAVVVVPRLEAGIQPLWGATPIGISKVYSDITATSAAWLTPDDGSRMVEIPRTVIDRALALESPWSTLTDIGGDRTSVVMPLLRVAVYAQTFDAASSPELHGLVVAEYIGGP